MRSALDWQQQAIALNRSKLPGLCVTCKWESSVFSKTSFRQPALVGCAIGVSGVGSCTLGLTFANMQLFRAAICNIRNNVLQVYKFTAQKELYHIGQNTCAGAGLQGRSLCLSSQTYAAINSTTECDSMIYEQRGVRTSQMPCKVPDFDQKSLRNCMHDQ